MRTPYQQRQRKLDLIRRIPTIFLVSGVILLAIFGSLRSIIIGKPSAINLHQAEQNIESSFASASSLCSQWLSSTDDEKFIEKLWKVEPPKVWSERGVTLMLYQNDSLVLWSNYVYIGDFNPLNLSDSVALHKWQHDKILVEKHEKGDKTAIVLLRLKSEQKGLNAHVFDGADGRIIPLDQSSFYPNAKAVGSRFLFNPTLIDDLPFGVVAIGWLGLILILIGIERVFRKLLTKRNAICVNFIFIGFLAILSFVLLSIDCFVYLDSYFYNLSVKFWSFDISVVKLVLVFVILHILSSNIYRTRYKIAYRYRRLSNTRQYILLGVILLFINAIVVAFHYTMVKLVYELSVNIELYKFTLINYSTLIFYLIGSIFVSVRILLNASVRFIFRNKPTWLSVLYSMVTLTLMIIPVHEEFTQTAYMLLLVHFIFVALSFVDKLKYVFLIIISVFSLYIMLLSIVENNVASDISAKEYARKLAVTTSLPQSEAEQFRKLTYYIITNHEIEVKDNNSFDLQQLARVINQKVDTTVSQSGYDHYVYHVNDSKTIVVSRLQISMLEYFAFFAYVFILLYLISGSLLRIGGYTRTRYRIRNNLVARIRLVVIGVVLFAMTMVLVVISINTFETFDSSQKKFINSRMSSLINSFAHFSGKNKLLEQEELVRAWFIDEVESTDADIIIYDSEGDLIASSLIVEVPNRISSDAYSALRWNSMPYYNHITEYKGRTYISAFLPVYNDGNHLGYVGMVQLYRINKISDDPRYDILTHIINILIVVVMLALVLSMFLYRMLTRPLQALSQGMESISSMRRIPETDGGSNDEIAMLIRQYNKMLDFLEESYDALAKSEREGAWREMARQVAHEIKNPLTPMRLKIQMLQRGRQNGVVSFDEKTEATLVILLEQIDLLAKIASEFSDFARMSETNIEQFDIGRLILSVLELYKNTSDNINFDADLSSDKLIVSADYSQIQRVLINLCKNALQAISDKSDGWVRISVEKEGDMAVIKVADNGSGIEYEQQKRIFEPNFTTKTSGNGLGLAMSRQIVLNLGGTISFVSAPGEGATFIVTLPLCD